MILALELNISCDLDSEQTAIITNSHPNKCTVLRCLHWAQHCMSNQRTDIPNAAANLPNGIMIGFPWTPASLRPPLVRRKTSRVRCHVTDQPTRYQAHHDLNLPRAPNLNMCFSGNRSRVAFCAGIHQAGKTPFLMGNEITGGHSLWDGCLRV